MARRSKVMEMMLDLQDHFGVDTWISGKQIARSAQLRGIDYKYMIKTLSRLREFGLLERRKKGDYATAPSWYRLTGREKARANYEEYVKGLSRRDQAQVVDI